VSSIAHAITARAWVSGNINNIKMVNDFWSTVPRDGDGSAYDSF
jgi:hypothetical protein